MSTSPLTSKPTHPDSQPPTVPPSTARTAQIPLRTFTLPPFPPEAQSLTSLTLTSDIPPSSYTALLTSPTTSTPIPPLPPTIENLTLELFSLGYPPPFLTHLSTTLPHLKSLIIYSQIFTGTTSSSLQDSIQFFRNEEGIRALHLLDVFVPSKSKAEFFEAIGPMLRKSLRFLEVNYTFRHEDGREFLRSLPGARELGELVGRGLVSCVFGMSAPEITGDEDDGEGEEIGILAIEEGAEDLVEALVGEQRPRGLLALDVTLFKLSVEQLRRLLEMQVGLKILAVTIEVGGERDVGVEGVVEALKMGGGALEEVEIVGFPGDEEFVERMKGKEEIGPNEEELEDLGNGCKVLRRVRVSILRTREVVWEKMDGKWRKM